MKYLGPERRRNADMLAAVELCKLAADIAQSLAKGDEPDERDMANLARHSARLLGVDPSEGWPEIIDRIDREDAEQAQRDHDAELAEQRIIAASQHE